MADNYSGGWHTDGLNSRASAAQLISICETLCNYLGPTESYHLGPNFDRPSQSYTLASLGAGIELLGL